MEFDFKVLREEHLVRQLEKEIAQPRVSFFSFVADALALVRIAAVQSKYLRDARSIKTEVELFAEEAVGVAEASTRARVSEAFNAYYEKFQQFELTCSDIIAEMRKIKQSARRNQQDSVVGRLLPLPSFVGWIIERQIRFHDTISNLRLLTAKVLAQVERPQPAYQSVSSMVDAIRSAHGA